MDKLGQAYGEWKAKQKDPGEWGGHEYEAFQGGFTAAAVSMRERAVAAVQNSKLPDALMNRLLSAIGQLSDIP